ncbi:MAG TPA: cupin domain-containing protein [Rhodanobacteraceae bacterium]|nr:cupin domain-containing protein [Rhodanobacteraceae bacterium]
MPKLELESIRRRLGTTYPAPFDQPCLARARRALGDAGGLGDFGVNLLDLPPGAWSSQRHWHSAEDEFVWVLSGEVVLVEDAGETLLRAGDCAAFQKGSANGHHLINRSSASATCLEVGTRSSDDVCTYSDIDMRIDSKIGHYTRKDGERYPDR